VTIKYGIFWDMTSCGSCKNRSFGGAYRLHHLDDNRGAKNNVSIRNTLISSLRASVVATGNVVTGWPILVILMMDATRSSETPVLTRVTRHNIPEDCA
jgi:hypothetical protein